MLERVGGVEQALALHLDFACLGERVGRKVDGDAGDGEAAPDDGVRNDVGREGGHAGLRDEACHGSST